MFLLLKAVVLGLSVAAPVGPIGVLCIRRSLADGGRLGLACGLGAATADALYGLVAALGFAAVSSVLVAHQDALRGAGAIYLAYLGAKTFAAQPSGESASVARASAFRTWLSTLLLTIANPMTIVSFAAMFSALALDGETLGSRTWLLVLGVFAGSAAWWLALSFSVSRLRSRIEPVHMRWINRASGILLLGFAIWAGYAAIGRAA